MKLNTATFQSYLDSALIQKRKPNERIELLDEENATKRFINSFSKREGMLFGQMLLYEEGKDQLVLIIDENLDEYPIETLSLAQEESGKHREVLESVLFFGVLENHVVILRSKALTARDFENHIMWLLRENTKILSEDDIILLSDQPTPQTIKKLQKAPIKKIALGAPLETTSSEYTKTEKTKKLNFRPTGKGFDLLAAACGENWLKSLKLEDSLDESNLQVNLEITYLRKTPEVGYKMLQNIATSLRHLEESDVKLELKGGGVIKGDEIKISSPISVMTNNGIIDSDDLYRVMAEWLKNKITQGAISL